MGIWPDGSDKSLLMRLRFFICYAYYARYKNNSVFLRSMGPDFSRFDLHGRRHRMCMVPRKFHSAASASHRRGGTDLLRRISEYSS